MAAGGLRAFGELPPLHHLPLSDGHPRSLGCRDAASLEPNSVNTAGSEELLPAVGSHWGFFRLPLLIVHGSPNSTSQQRRSFSFQTFALSVPST